MHLLQERWIVTALNGALAGAARRNRTIAQGILVALGVIGIDQSAKTWVLRSIGPTDERHVIGNIRLILRFNRGAAFSIGSGTGLTAWLATALVVLLVGWCIYSWRKPVALPMATILGFIVGGAVANQLDRLLRGPGWNRGSVVDFVDVGFWPVWNLADASLSCGCAAFVVYALWHDRRSRASATAATDPNDAGVPDAVSNGGGQVLR